MKEIAKEVYERLAAAIGPADFQLPTFLEKPVYIGDDYVGYLENQQNYINDFFDKVGEIARVALANNQSDLIKILFSQPVGGMDLSFHRALPDCCWRRPIFYRTDQSISGKVYEIQSPGSGWGDLPLLLDVFASRGYAISPWVINFTHSYAQIIIESTGHNKPKVFHMLDAASAPVGMRFLLASTRPPIRYWGLDRDVSMDAVDFVTAHSSAALTMANYFSRYLKLAEAGDLVFGLPPNLLYDQKAIYLLPFYRSTRSLFSSKIKDMFPFTTMVENCGFYDKTDSFVPIDTFDVWRKTSRRRWYLKYGGTDLGRNWGSRSVWRLDGSDAKKLLRQAAEKAARGEVWLLQEDVSRDNPDRTSSQGIQYLMTGKNERKHIKISAFYGGVRLLGTKVMVRKHFKVHGQFDTAIGIGI